jgi:excisionase family DNA binding protein
MELLTIQETARMLKVNPITIRRYIESGRLPAVRVGRGVRVRKEAVDQLIEEVVWTASSPLPLSGRSMAAQRPSCA